MKKLGLAPLVLLIGSAWGLSVLADDVVGVLPAVEVVGVSPVASINIPVNQYPGNIQVLRENDIESLKSSSFSELLSRTATSVNLNEIQGNPFQLDLNYRGQRLSSVLGAAQGISAYLDGVRINEAFGDVISWDMLPESAISTITLVPGSNPMYGMNTLAGALVMTTKNGITHEGGEFEVSGGSFGRIRTDVGMGKKLADGYHLYVAATGFREDGWREKSDSKLANAFIKYGRETEKTNWDFSFTTGAGDLKGNGLLPRDQYLTAYRNGYTFSDITKTTAQQLAFNFAHKLSNEEKVSLVTWVRHAKRSGSTGDVNGAYLDNCLTGPAYLCSSGGVNSAVINKNEAQYYTLGLTTQWDKKIEAHKVYAGATLQYTKSRYQSWESNDFDFVGKTANLADVTGYTPLSDHQGKTIQSALFIGDVFTPQSGTLFNGGLRFDYTKVRNNLSNDGAAAESETFSYRKLNPSVGLSQQLTKSTGFFANWSQGMRVPSAFELGCANDQVPCRVPTGLQSDPYLKPIISQTTEIGFRLNPNDNTRVTLTGFYNLNKDDVAFIRALSSPNGNAGYFSNIGETLRRGVELAGRYKRSTWELGASYTYLKATYQSDFNLPSLQDAGGTGKDYVQVTPGTRIAGLPEHFFKLAGLYRVTPQWRVGADIQIFGSQVVAGNETKNATGSYADQASGKDKLAGYGILNFNTNYEIQRGLNTFIRVNNVFDKRYASYAQLGYNMFPSNSVITTGPPDGSVFYAPGAPRSIYAGVRYEWQ